MRLRLWLIPITFFVLGLLVISKPASANTVLNENVAHPMLVTPDGYRIKSPHFRGVRLHQSAMYVRAHDYIILREYVTPFGLVSLEQTNAVTPRRPSGFRRQVASQTTTIGGQVPVVASGQTPHGADWFLISYDVDWLLHLQFPDGSADLWLPVNTPLNYVSIIANGIY